MAFAVEAAAQGNGAGACARSFPADDAFASVSSQIIRRLRIRRPSVKMAGVQIWPAPWCRGKRWWAPGLVFLPHSRRPTSGCAL